MRLIQDLFLFIRQANKYMAARQATAAAGGAAPQVLLLKKAAAYATRILSVFGIVDGAADSIGFPAAEGQAGSGGVDAAAGFVDAIAAFRDDVRDLCRAGAEKGELMAACDRLRDETLVDLGIRCVRLWHRLGDVGQATKSATASFQADSKMIIVDVENDYR
jgi:cysteinyl-tRNA synthetase